MWFVRARSIAGVAAVVALFWVTPAIAQAQSGSDQPSLLRVSLGVALDTVSLVVRAVLPGSSAANAGLTVGDRLTRIDGQLATHSRFIAAVSKLGPADTVVLGVRRQDRAITLRLGANPSAASYLIAACAALDSLRLPPGAASQQMILAVPRGCSRGQTVRSSTPPGNATVLRTGDPGVRTALNIGGMFVLELSPALADYFDVPGGLLVTEVTSQTAAARAGVRAGDVIVMVNGAVVKSMVDIMRAGENGAAFTIGVRRNGRSLTLKLSS